MSAEIREFSFDADIMDALLWQYNDGGELEQLLELKQKWYDENHTKFWLDWYRDVFNIDTANDFGLSVWAIILDLPLMYSVTGTGDRPVWGFGDPNGNFSVWHGDTGPKVGTNFGRDSDQSIGLSTDEKRLLIKLMYLAYTGYFTVPYVNRALGVTLGKHVTVRDNLDMTFTFVTTQPITDRIEKIASVLGSFPHPTGVGYTVEYHKPTSAFGFRPVGRNFNHGNFTEQENEYA